MLHQRSEPTILVVEDDPALRRLIVRMLTTHGYSTVDTGSAAEALGIARERQGGFALAIVAAVLSWPITTILGVLLCVPSLALSVYVRKRNPGNRAALGALTSAGASFSYRPALRERRHVPANTPRLARNARAAAIPRDE